MTKPIAPLRLAALSSAVLAIFAATPAAAQDGGGRGWTVTVGAGGQAIPKYPGADSLGITVLPIFGLRRPGAPLTFDTQDDGVGFGILGRDSVVNFGPSLSLRSKREQDDVGAPVGDVDLTIEAGGFVELNPSRNIRLRADVRQGLNGHDGLTADVGADFIARDDDTYIFSVGPRARWADNDFHDAYFGVPVAIPASGLAAYNPGGGFYAVGAMAGITYKLGRNWGVQGYAGYDRLINDAGDSPIVRQFGSRDQFSGGLGLFFEFNVGG